MTKTAMRRISYTAGDATKGSEEAAKYKTAKG